MTYTAQQKNEFLSFMRIAIGNKAEDLPACGDVAWEEVFNLAEQHHVLPMVTDAAHQIYGDEMPWERLMKFKKRAMRITYLQAVKTERFLSLYRFLIDKGLTPLVMKGLICRDMYPNPDFRFSADEDLLAMPVHMETYHKAFLEYGLKTESSVDSAASEQEISYKSEDGVLFLEVHSHAFPQDSAAYGEYSFFFEDIFDRAVTEVHSGVEIKTMAPSDHLLYLICHLLKHFYHGGCGIRQICDIGLFVKEHGKQIDWLWLEEEIDSIHARDFVISVFAIAEKSLGIDLAYVPDGFFADTTDYQALLEDILESGVYGSSTMSRKHSATITLRAAESAKLQASGIKSHRVRTIFPSAKSMSKNYPYLVKHPWLLPYAWLQRIFRYFRSNGASNTPGEALRIGHKRVDLMKQYGLLSQHPVKKVDTVQYLSTLCELIEQGHEVSVPIVGSSMVPFLGDGRDQAFVKAPDRTLRRGDIVLYRRSDGNFVLHRVFRVYSDGDSATYDMIGDAQSVPEYGIHRKQVFAIATKVRRKEKIIGPGHFLWWFFQHVWIRLIPFRRFLIQLVSMRHYWF